MKNFTSLAGIGFLVKLCLCLFISGSGQAQIIYQHNFENLDNPPTNAQLSTPSVIHPDLISVAYGFSPPSTRTDAGNKALAFNLIPNNISPYRIEIQSSQCKKLAISSISFKAFASKNARFRIEINGEPYGDWIDISGNMNVVRTQKINVGSVQDRGLGLRIDIMIWTSEPSIATIDDVTIEGILTNTASKLETIEFPSSDVVPAERCPDAVPTNYVARLNVPYKSISYVLDEASVAAGVTLTNTLVTFPPTFVGKTAITATATGCANDVLSKTFEVVTTPSGPPSIDMDFTTGILGDNCSTCGDLKNAKNPCFDAGFIHKGYFGYSSVDVKVRFEGGVRNFDITGSPRPEYIIRPGFDLYFLQSDFDKYRGISSLPTGPSDEQGKENVRLMIRAGNGSPVQKIKPTVSWNEAGKWWVVSYQFSDKGLAIPWPANNFKVFLGDAGLPMVKLDSIYGLHSSEGDLLTWKTSEETGFKHFAIENSEDTLKGFQYVATVAAKFNSSGGEYHYTHIPSASSKQFYRLKMVYSDNTFAYSKIATVRADIVYQHNFDNLSTPPNDAELGNPNVISPGFTSSWTKNTGTIGASAIWPRSKILYFDASNSSSVLTLKLTVPKFKKLEINGISLAVFKALASPDTGKMRIRFGQSDGRYDISEQWSVLNIDRVTSELEGEISIEISQPDAPYGGAFYIDDFTVYGKITDILVNVETFAGVHGSQGDVLTWKTSKETSFSHFEIENSEEALQGFKYIATVPSNNNPAGGEYQYTHVPSAAGKQYYRLKIVYADNTFKYSKTALVRSDIVYQHNFENLGNPATAAQLSEPNIIGPGIISSWTGNAGSFISDIDWPRGKVLSFKTSTVQPVLTLTLKLPNCKKLNITDISFAIYGAESTSFDGRLRIKRSQEVEEFYNIPKGWSTLNVSKVTSTIKGEITIEISLPYYYAGREIYLDDFTIYGNYTDNLVDLRTIYLSGPPQRCQQGEIADYSVSNKAEFNSIQYSLDDASIAAGNQIDASTGVMTFASTFSGESTINATAISCINLPLSVAKKVITSVGGLPSTDMDLLTTNDNKELRNGCFTTGLTVDSRRNYTAKVRFIKQVRNIEINRLDQGYNRPEIQLYFSQSDFDNFQGALKLPQNPSDEQGIANLRLRLVSENFGSGEADIIPELRWDYLRKYWIITLRFLGADGEINVGTPPNAPWAFPTFRAFLIDRETPFPVKLESISAKSTPEGNRIIWKTTEEINFSHFEVEKSEDPRQGFQFLATVSSAKSPSGSAYHYTDVPSSALQQYYRLRMVDFDGSFEYSKIVTAGGQLKKDQLLVYPNPAQNLLFLESPDAVKSVTLFDQKGNEVLGKSFLDGEKAQTIPLPKLQSGEYFLKVNPGTESQQARKIVIE